MIRVQLNSDGCLEVRSGYLRLMARLEAYGSAEVMDVGTGKLYQVHEIGGMIVAVSDELQANIETQANTVIHRARNGIIGNPT